LDNAGRLVQAGAHLVKLEGGAWLVDTVNFLTWRGVPVLAHLGPTPQSVHRPGGFNGAEPSGEAIRIPNASALFDASIVS
jgi:3-methyl-2-oxobutanoate hydroxymethyltransferase